MLTLQPAPNGKQKIVQYVKGEQPPEERAKAMVRAEGQYQSLPFKVMIAARWMWRLTARSLYLNASGATPIPIPVRD